MNPRKLMIRLLNGHHRNVRFEDFVNVVVQYGFRLDHIEGSHHIFIRPYIPEKLNLQPKNGEAKSYQIKQFLFIVEKYSLLKEKDN